MRTIVVVDDPKDWPTLIPEVDVVRASDYLARPEWSAARGVRVFNLCRTYRYQSTGYYVSLLATARRHRPFPDLLTVLDMKSRAFVRGVSEEIQELIDKTLAPIRSPRFTLSVYFGKNLARRYDRLSLKLFQLAPAPLLRAQFRRDEDGWVLSSLGPVPAREIPDDHRPFAAEAAAAYFARPRYRSPSKRQSRFDLAILVDPAEELAPSDPRALKRFERAAQGLGFEVEVIDKDDFGRLAEFDALFLRETTSVNHHTFRFARRAESEGLVVIDDPQSILRCSNKVYMSEAFERDGVPVPKTMIADSADPAAVEAALGFPCVLKSPDSSFSQGVKRCADPEEYEREATRFLEESDLIVVQEFLPSDFDWRVGVFEGEALFAARYHMAAGHWQIVRKTDEGGYRYGRVEALPLAEVPPKVISTAVKAAGVIGNGLYGVDLKQVGKRVLAIEVNDNPNINTGCEDAVMGDELYVRIMEGILRRVEARKLDA
ncbi:MAG: RimK family protein [Gemmatimonadota bacterium]